MRRGSKQGLAMSKLQCAPRCPIVRPIQDVPGNDSGSSAALTRIKHLLELFTKHQSVLMHHLLVHNISRETGKCREAKIKARSKGKGSEMKHLSKKFSLMGEICEQH